MLVSRRVTLHLVVTYQYHISFVFVTKFRIIGAYLLSMTYIIVDTTQCVTYNVSWWHPASKNLLRSEAGYPPALRCNILKQNTGHTHNTRNTGAIF